MFEKPSSTVYDNYLIANLNMVLRELFEENNMARYFNGQKPLTEVPYVTTSNDEVNFRDEYCHEVIPYGLASKFFIDDDLSKFNLYNTFYNNARVENQKIVSLETIEEIDAS